MDYLCCCLGRRKAAGHSPNSGTTSSSRLSDRFSLTKGLSGGDVKALIDLRQKCGENTLTTAEARALLDASSKLNAPLTPREIEELHRILSPPQPSSQVPKTDRSLAFNPQRPPRTPTNQMLPEVQGQSDLFCLPAEVRAQIWRYAVGGRKIYLAVKRGKLVQQENIEHPYWRHINGLLRVPLLCRKSYLESINLLYSENTFGFGFGSSNNSKDFITQMDTFLLPQCTGVIHSLEIGFHLSGGYSQFYDSHPQAWDISLQITAPEPLSNWNSVFKSLAQMKQLKSLVVVVWVSGDRRHEFTAREEELMDIPTKMTGLEKFEVWLPWQEDEGGRAEQFEKRIRPYIVKREFEDRERFGCTVFAMLQLGRGKLCRLTTSRSSPIAFRRAIFASHHARSFTTTIACQDAATPETWPAKKKERNENEENEEKKEKKWKARKPTQKRRTPTSTPVDELLESDAQRQLKVLQGALEALKNVLASRGIDVGQVSNTNFDQPITASPLPTDHENKSQPKAKYKSKAKFKGAKKGHRRFETASTLDVLKEEAKASEAETQPNIPETAQAHSSVEADTPDPDAARSKLRTGRDRKPNRSQLQAKSKDSGRVTRSPKSAGLGKPFRVLGSPVADDQPRQPWFGKPISKISKVRTRDLSLLPIDTKQPAVPSLSYDLERVLFNPGVYQLQDPRSRVYNFDPYLSEIMPVNEFDFNALKEYVTSSKDTTLISIAKEHQKKYTGSTSSMTSMLAHFHYLLSAWRDINVTMMSRAFEPESTRFTRIMRAPAATFLHWKDGTYAIDADKEYDTANILSMLGKSMEKLLTLSKDDYERYRHGNSDQITEEERNAEEAFHYTGFQDFMMRSQLDAYDPRIPGTGMFDLKTRAVVSIRMDAKGYEKGLGYEIRRRFGQWESYEREYYDMIRSAFLKYSLQVRMGRMDGIFVAFHNTQRIFGFQYISLPEMDLALHGTENTQLGDREFKVSLKLMNELLNRATQKWPEQSLRLHFETRESKGAPFMYFFAKPAQPREIAAVQNAGKASIEAFERDILGMVKHAAENEVEHAVEMDNTNEEEFDSVEPSAAQESESSAAWQEARQMVEEAMDDDELGVGLVREAIGDALEQSGILRARSSAEAREYVDALIEAITGRPPSALEESPSIGPHEEETIDEDENAEQITKGSAVAKSQSESHIDSRNPDASSLLSEDSLHIDEPAAYIREIQPQNPQTATTTEEANKDVSTKADNVSMEELDEDEEEEQDDDYYEETGEFEVDGDIEVKRPKEDTVPSSLEPLKKLIVRMAQRIDGRRLSHTDTDSSQDDESKLKVFERTLGRLISQSKTGQFQRESDGFVLEHDTSSESAPLNDASATESKVDEETNTVEAQGLETPQVTVAEQSRQPDQGIDEPELLALVLTIKNKVNGVYVDRPGKLLGNDDWTVEYDIQEVNGERAQKIYQQCTERRRKVFQDTGDKETEWYKMFSGQLKRATEQGRKYRAGEAKRAEGRPMYMVGTEKPLQWEDVFRGQPKDKRISDNEHGEDHAIKCTILNN
ncbi:Pet127-domain-containing protein [Xylariaceae sp. FL1651]|nr:Pet127-domain-containing protein [Xylariaceae sp. FL1651]